MEIQQLQGPSPLRSYAPTAADWDRYRDLITELYVSRAMKQKEVASYMWAQHGFWASEKMYNTRFKEWRINKKMDERYAKAIINAMARRTGPGRKVTAIRLRERQVTEHAASSYFKRKKLSIPAPDTAASTPSDISIDSEDEVDNSHSPMDIDEESRGLLADAVVRQRPRTPSLVGEEQLEVFFIRKMQDWREGSPVTRPASVDDFPNYMDDLLDVVHLPNPTSNPRTRWTISRLEPTLQQAFRVEGIWLLAGLAHSAAHLMAHKKHCGHLVQYVLATVVRVAKETVDHQGHPLLVVSGILFGTEGRQLNSRILRHCSALAQQTFGVGSWEHRTIDSGRSRCHSESGEVREAEIIATDLVRTLSNGSSHQRDMAVLHKCDLTHLYINRGNLVKAEVVNHEVLEYCHQASQDQVLAIVRLQYPLTTAYAFALQAMLRFTWEKNDLEAVEYWAREWLSHCEQAFGTSDM